MAYGDPVQRGNAAGRIGVGILVGAVGIFLLYVVNPLLVLAFFCLGTAYSCLSD